MRRAVISAGMAGVLAAQIAVAQRTPQVVLIPSDSTRASLEEFKALQQSVAANPNILIVKTDGAAVASPSTQEVKVQVASAGATPTSAVQLRADWVEAAEKEVGALLKDEPESSTSFLRLLEKKFREADTPLLEVSNTRTIAPAGPLSGAARPRLLGFGATSNPTNNRRMGTGLLRAWSQGLPLSGSKLKLLGFKIPDSVTAVFDSQYNATLNTFGNAIVQPTSANQAALQMDAKLTRDKFIEVWPLLRNDAVRRRETVRRFAGLMEQSPLKAAYGPKSIFDPFSYSKIFVQGRRTVALVERDEKFCSGYLLSAEWVMTAGHCLKRGDAQAMQVWVSVDCPDQLPEDETKLRTCRNSVETLKDGRKVGTVKIPVIDNWPVNGTGRSDADSIDFTFLRISDSPLLEEHWDPIKQVPVCLQKEPLAYEQAVIVIGYRPGTLAQVYDHANVWFPFKAGSNRYAEISAMTGARLQRLAEAWFALPADQEKFFEDNMSDFEKSYAPNGSVREYRAERAGLVKRPYFGMDTDTFHGNSGAPVFYRNEVCIVGVFSGGAGENAEILEGTWKEHEFAIPLSEIVAHVKSVPTDQGGATSDQKAARERLLALMPQ